MTKEQRIRTRGGVSFPFLVAIIIIVFGVALFLYQRQQYEKAFQSLRGVALNSEQEITRLTSLLNQTQSLLQHKEEEVTQATTDRQEAITVLRDDISGLNDKIKNLERLLREEKKQRTLAQKERSEAQKKLEELQEELRLWSGDIQNLQEAGLVRKRQHQSRQALSYHIQRIRSEVSKKKQQMQEQIDRIESSLGNKGFMTKDGKTTYSSERAIQLESIIVKPPRAQ